MKNLKSIILIHVGLILVAAAIVLFKVPNNFVTGGVTGISIVIKKIFPFLSIGLVMLVINIVLLSIGFLYTSSEFQIKSIYSTIMLSLLVWYSEKILPIDKPLTDDPLLELITAIFLLAGGTAILFYQNASSGGTDIIARILNIKTHMHIGKTVLITDLIISISSFFVFNVKVGLFSCVGVVIKGFLIDMVIEGLHSSKQVIIISSKSNEIKKFIMEKLGRGVTMYTAVGGNTNIERNVLNTIMGNQETIKLKQFIKKTDSHAFVTVNNVSEIIGEGFKLKEL
jgi:uncharacterized membrane-anchored protein YitT (DUF2179 family)